MAHRALIALAFFMRHFVGTFDFYIIFSVSDAQKSYQPLFLVLYIDIIYFL